MAIMAEIIEVKNQNKRVCGYLEDLLEAILDIVHPGKKMLATIITRKGSAPRNVGSKMLILEDGSLCWNHRRRLYGGRGFKKSESHDAKIIQD